MTRKRDTEDRNGEGRFAYDGLDRVLHEKARLGILTSLVAHPDGLKFGELRGLCSLTDGNLSRHLDVLRDAHVNAAPARLAALPPLDAGEICHRCGSDEIYPATSRARAYARALILSMLGGVLVQFIVIVTRMAGFHIPQRAINLMFLLMLAAPLITAVVINISPRMVCRNCQAEWRAGTNLPS